MSFEKEYRTLAPEQIKRCLEAARVCRESRRVRRYLNTCGCFCCYVEHQEYQYLGATTLTPRTK